MEKEPTGAVRQPQSLRPKNTGRGFRLNTTKEELIKNIGAEYVRDVGHRGRTFVVSDQLRSQIVCISTILSEDKDKYGLLICGKVGNGKSTAVRAIYRAVNGIIGSGRLSKDGNVYDWDYMAIVNARDMVRSFIRDYDGEFAKLKSRRYLIIDDIGTDQKEVSLYGTVFNPFMELLDYRYEHLLPTVIVSNLNAKMIVEKYGDPRLSDRMREMFSIVTFENKSFRI